MVEFDKDINIDDVNSSEWFGQLGRFLLEHPEPKTYTVKHVEITRATIDEGDVREILEPVFQKAEGWQTPEEFAQRVAEFSPAQRLVQAVWQYDAEVNEGGHEQFFKHLPGMLWREVLEGLDLIGATSTKQILRDAVARFRKPPARDAEKRNKQCAGLDFDDLDTRFYLLEDEDLQGLMVEYIQAHPREFLFSGELQYQNPSSYKCVYGKNGFRWEPKTGFEAVTIQEWASNVAEGEKNRR